MEENFTKDQLQSILFNMKIIEPAFNNWTDLKLKNLTRAIYKCGYSWDEQDKDIGFFHPKNKLILNFKGLHYYTPESIIDTYNRVWSKDSVEKKIEGKLRVKSFWLWIISFLSLFFIDFIYAVFIISLLFIRFIYYAVKSGKK